MQKNAWKVSQVRLILNLSCFHRICEGNLSRLGLGLKIIFLQNSAKKDDLEIIEYKRTYKYNIYIYRNSFVEFVLIFTCQSPYKFTLRPGTLDSISLKQCVQPKFPELPSPQPLTLLICLMAFILLNICRCTIGLAASLPVRGIVRLFGGYEDMCMNQAFYVQDLGCNTTCKNAKKMHGKCLKHAWSWPILLSQHLRRHSKSATFGPKNHFFCKKRCWWKNRK